MNTGYIIQAMDYNKIVAHCDKTIKEEQEKIRIYKVLINQLENQDGKKITKRIDKYSQIEGYYISHVKRYDRHYLYISNKNSGFNFDMGLCDYKEEKLNLEYIKKSLNSLQDNVKKDIESNKNITETISIYNTALKYYKEAEENLKNLPGFYSFDRW